MSNNFRGRGNLGDNPSLKYVPVAGEQRAVCELRVYFDRSVPDNEGGFTDRGGFWLDVTVWDIRGEQLARTLSKGTRVCAEGVLVQESWNDKVSGEARSKFVLQADHVDLDLMRVELVTLRKREAAALGHSLEPVAV